MKYSDDLINFFKRHGMYDEIMFDYLQCKSIMIDFRDPDQKILVGSARAIDRDNRLRDIILVMPFIYDKETMLVSINTLVHGIEAFPYLGKHFPKDYPTEALPLLYEKIYLEEQADNSLRSFAKRLDDMIRESDDKKYKIGLLIRDELFKEYDFNMKKMQNKAKKLSRKYR